MPPRLTITLEAAVAAFAEQSAAVLGWAGSLTDDSLAAPSALPAWSVGQLVGHLAVGVEMVPEMLAQPNLGTALPLGVYVSRYAPAAQDIADIGQDATPPGVDPRPRLQAACAAAVVALEGASGDAVVTGRRGPISVTDAVVTRLFELVAHSFDLGAPVVKPALGVVVKAFARIVAEAHPGHAVELRVPPYAAVQIVEGPRHRRGTPPAVVETTPEVWVRLATGRLAWADAARDGRVRASGERSDLSPLLPLLS